MVRLSAAGKKIPGSLVIRLREFLGYDGCAWFMMHKENTGTVSPLLRVRGMPHPVHFREGMQIRNFMRTCPECEGWTDHDFDNNWAKAIELAIYA